MSITSLAASWSNICFRTSWSNTSLAVSPPIMSHKTLLIYYESSIVSVYYESGSFLVYYESGSFVIYYESGSFLVYYESGSFLANYQFHDILVLLWLERFLGLLWVAEHYWSITSLAASRLIMSMRIVLVYYESSSLSVYDQSRSFTFHYESRKCFV